MKYRNIFGKNHEKFSSFDTAKCKDWAQKVVLDISYTRDTV